jgi:hypothetical protein
MMFGVRRSVFGVGAALAVLVLLAGCAIAPEQELPEGVVDQKADLVSRIKDAPDDLDAHADLLRMQIRDGDVEGAEATVSHALKHNGTDYRAHLLAAQHHRWQGDLIGAEKSLLAARDMAPQKLEPRVALSGLYHQTYLEEEELEQRRIAYELADPAYRAELLLDYAYACAQLGRDAKARELIHPLADDSAADADSRSRAHALLCETALRAGEQGAAIDHLLAARKLSPEENGLILMAARLVSVVEEPAALSTLFDETLASQDTAEARWGALFGKWMLAVRDAEKSRADPLAGESDSLYQRMNVVAADHPDTLTRRFQLVALDPARSVQMEETRKKLADSEFGVPVTPGSLAAVLKLWRAEDALRVGAPAVALHEITQLEARDSSLGGLPVLRTIALFKAREDDRCIAGIEAWQSENEPDAMLESVRWWIMLRDGRGKEVLVELEKREEPSNATLWIAAVAQFHVYRATAAPAGDG